MFDMKIKFKAKKLIIIAGAVLILIGFAHFSFAQYFGIEDNQDNDSINSNVTEPTMTNYNGESSVSNAEYKKIQKQITKISSFYKDIHRDAEKSDAPNWDLESEYAIDRQSKDKIEDVLISKGYAVINSDENYPEYLENANDFKDFWNSVKNNIEGTTTFWELTNSGGLIYRSLQFSDGKVSNIIAFGNWIDDKNMELIYAKNRLVHNWNMTSNGDFYYQDLVKDRHYDATKLIRLNPVDKELYNLCKKYIEPLGYQGMNIFLSDWNEDDYSNLSFNDLYEQMYKMKYNSIVPAENYKEEYTPYYYYCIPAEEFEDIVFSFFNISLEKFRELSRYDSKENIYPWIESSVSNISYYPTIIPEVIDMKKYEDGRIKLTVNTMCLDKGTDSLFIHEVTVLTTSNGNFKYLGNKIINKGKHELPSTKSRYELQQAN